MDIWLIKSLFIRGSYTQNKFQKNKVASGKTLFFLIGPFCTSHSICLKLGF